MFKSVLVLAPHTDDAELGCGGTISWLLEQGTDVRVVVFCTCEESLPAGSRPNMLEQEFRSAMAKLGIGMDKQIVYDFPVRRLSYYRQEVLERLIKLRNEIQPDLVLLPSGADVHQDHNVVFNEGLRAFKDRTMFGYELPWNHITFSAQAFVRLGRRHIDAKWTALQEYASQFELERPYFDRELIYGLARVRGTQIKTTYAEAFEVLRLSLW